MGQLYQTKFPLDKFINLQEFFYPHPLSDTWILYQDRKEILINPNVQNAYFNYILSTSKDTINRTIRQKGKWEEYYHDVMKKHIQPKSIVLDIGANLGAHSLFMAYCFPGVIVQAWEPQRILYYQLCANILLNKFENQIIAHNIALGNQINDKCELFIPFENKGGASLMQSTYIKECVVNSETVSMKRLDDYNLTNISFIKMDVEGAEYDVLLGARNTLTKNKLPPILIEIFPENYKKVTQLLIEIGYHESTKLYNDDYLFSNVHK